MGSGRRSTCGWRPSLTISEDDFFEITKHYLDTGQFGVVPIFAPFNYSMDTSGVAESGGNYKINILSIYANLTVGRNSKRV